MGLATLELVDFRSFASAHFTPHPEGTTVLLAPNGTGKTSLLEAVGYLGTGRSFRGAARETMIRTGADDAYVRATVLDGRPTCSSRRSSPGTGARGSR